MNRRVVKTSVVSECYLSALTTVHCRAFTKFATSNNDMYILKIKGKAKIPDYVQLRDDQFMLLAYFRVDRPEKALGKCGFGDKEAEMIRLINEMPFGKVMKLEI
jgi:hypothetical protein